MPGSNQFIAVNYGDPLPEAVVDATQEVLGSLGRLDLTLADATTVRALAGPGADEAGMGVGGALRWVDANVDRAMPAGAAGRYDVWVTAGPTTIDFSSAPPVDTTDYTWALAITATGGAAPSTAYAKKVGYLDWSGTAITRLVQTFGRRDDAPKPAVSPLPGISAVEAMSPAGATAPPIRATVGGTEVWRVNPDGSSTAAVGSAGQTSVGGVGPGGSAGIQMNDALVYRYGAGVVGVAGLHATGNITVDGTATFTGIPTGPTAAPGTNTTQLATTAFVATAVASAAPPGAAYLGNTQTFSGVNTFNNDVNVIGGGAGHGLHLWSGAGTGSHARLVTDASVYFQHSVDVLFTDINAATPRATITTTGYVDAATGLRINGTALASTHLSDSAALARLASPTFTGAPLAPTAAPGTNTQQLATTAFVAAAVSGVGVSDPIVLSAGASEVRLGSTQGTGGLPGLRLGGDTYLYRSAATTLKTDQTLHVGADFRHLGTNVGFYGVAAVARPAARTLSNWTTGNALRTIDRNNWTGAQLFDFVMTMANDLILNGLYQ